MTRTSTSASPRPTSLHAGVLTTLVLVVLAFCTAQAGEAPRPATTPDPPSVEMAPTTASMRVAIDPVTGQITMPGEDGIGFQPLWSMSLVPSAPLPVVRLADGSLMVDLRGIFLTSAVASIGWNGRPTLGCAEFGVDPAEYARWLTLTAAPTRAKVSE